MSKYKLGQKVTISRDFYAPVNGIITKIETGLAKNNLSISFDLSDYINRCNKYDRYEVSYEQHGFMNRIDRRSDIVEDEIKLGWSGMKRNGDYYEFKKFGVEVPGITKPTPTKQEEKE